MEGAGLGSSSYSPVTGRFVMEVTVAHGGPSTGQPGVLPPEDNNTACQKEEFSDSTPARVYARFYKKNKTKHKVQKSNG